MAGLTTTEWGPVGAPVMVLLHGFMGSGKDWAAIAAELPEFRIVAPDLPGHGGSTGLSEDAYTLAGAAALASAVLDSGAQAGSDLSLLAGYSMGGRIAQEILSCGALPPDAGLCLIGAHPGYSTEAERAQRLRSDQSLADLIIGDFETTLDEWLALPMFSSLTPVQREDLRSQRLAGCQPVELARALRGLSTGHQPDRRPVLTREASRISLVAGALDQRYVQLLSGLAPETKTISGAGHNLLAERPGELAVILRQLALRRLGSEEGA